MLKVSKILTAGLRDEEAFIMKDLKLISSPVVSVCVFVGGLHRCVHGDDPNSNLTTEQNEQVEKEGERL